MDFIFGFFVGYLCKEIVSYLKKLANEPNKYDWDKEWDWLSHEDLP